MLVDIISIPVTSLPPPYALRLCDLIRMILAMNSFEFNNTFYIQTHGTAMGTRMAPSYANLFLAKFETDALTHAPHQPGLSSSRELNCMLYLFFFLRRHKQFGTEHSFNTISSV